MLLFSFLPSPYRGRTVWGKGRVKLYYRANKDISHHVMFWCLGVPHNGVLKMLSYVMVPPATLLNQHTTGDKRKISQPGLLCVPAKNTKGSIQSILPHFAWQQITKSVCSSAYAPPFKNKPINPWGAQFAAGSAYLRLVDTSKALSVSHNSVPSMSQEGQINLKCSQCSYMSRKILLL